MCTLSPFSFHGDTIFCIDYQNQPFTPMRPIVENMGLGWASQSQKLNANKERWTVTNIVTVAQDGVEREMLSMPVRKLPAWLNSINPKKVAPELRERIELYQAECDDALWNYWMNGRAERATPEPVSNPDKLPAASPSITPSTVADRKPLRSLVNAWARVSGHPFDACWSQLKAAFSLTDIRDLPQEWIPDAVAWVQERIDKIGREPQTPGTMPALLPSTPGILSAELERYASKFERLAHSVEDMEQLLESVRRLSYPLTSEAARTLTGGHADGRGRLEAALEEHLDRSRRLAQELVPCARLGINIMRDMALGQGR